MTHSYTIVGLGNPGEEYASTRHNMGRIVLEKFLKSKKLNMMEYDKKTNSLKLEEKIGKNKVVFLSPETFMNNSGKAVMKIITSKKKAKDLVVIHDDVDLPLGVFKISFNRGPAGHKGVQSIIRAIKTQEFARIRVGISPTTPSGKLKKPKIDKFNDFITGNFKPKELDIIKKTLKQTSEALETILEEGYERAMNKWN